LIEQKKEGVQMDKRISVLYSTVALALLGMAVFIFSVQKTG